mmetsp:Transcript_44494/g.59033  ORF Transcript_44494/g.59033 Transcript_44494/m.59033 type:complete len:94 (-) Transcript_44494:764-1045(-)
MSTIACALFELKTFKSRNSFGQWNIPSNVIKLVTDCCRLREKQDMQARKQLYFSEQDCVLRTRMCRRVLPDWMAKGAIPFANAFADRYTGYYS